MRADELVAKRLEISRNKASEMLKNAQILINDKVAKASQKVSEDAKISQLENFYVSRAAFKLKGFLDDFSEFEIARKTCIDVGASTGGFTQILLEKGAKKVVCVDVGKGQLHKSLLIDSRVENVENTDIRDFCAKPFDLLVADLSFISIDKVIDKLILLAISELILLFKPQFEVGKDAARSKNGVLKNDKQIQKALMEFEKTLERKNLRIIKKQKSLLSGKEGNYEYFYALRK